MFRCQLFVPVFYIIVLCVGVGRAFANFLYKLIILLTLRTVMLLNFMFVYFRAF